MPTTAMTVETIFFASSDWVPNHPDLPVLIYRNATPAENETASFFERRFMENGWQGVTASSTISIIIPGHTKFSASPAAGRGSSSAGPMEQN